MDSILILWKKGVHPILPFLELVLPTHPPQYQTRKLVNMEILSVEYSRTACVKYVENFRWVRLNGKKDYVGKIWFLLQSKNADFTNITHFLFMVIIFIYLNYTGCRFYLPALCMKFTCNFASFVTFSSPLVSPPTVWPKLDNARLESVS
jgi:hypothetical protein